MGNVEALHAPGSGASTEGPTQRFEAIGPMAPGFQPLRKLSLAINLRKAKPTCPLPPHLMGKANTEPEGLGEGLYEHGGIG
jgi:hypothetical protein